MWVTARSTKQATAPPGERSKLSSTNSKVQRREMLLQALLPRASVGALDAKRHRHGPCHRASIGDACQVNHGSTMSAVAGDAVRDFQASCVLPMPPMPHSVSSAGDLLRTTAPPAVQSVVSRPINRTSDRAARSAARRRALWRLCSP